MRRVSYIRTLLMLLLIGTTAVSAQPTGREGTAKSLMGIEVHFRFDKSDLDLSYMGNEQSLDRFTHVIDSIGKHLIDSVVIVSQSSPEGVYEHNLKLSRQRAATMRTVIEQRHSELIGRLYTHPDGESWGRLREYVKNDKQMKQETIDKILSIIDSDVNVGTKKWRLEQLPIYRYLRMTYFPRIRNSVFCIIYYEKPEPVEVTPEESKPEEKTDVVEVVPEPAPEPAPEPTPAPAPRVPFMNIHTNMLYDVFLTPNIGLEFYIGNRYAVAANYSSAWWSLDAAHRYMQLIDGEIEGRRYFKNDRTHTGHYLSAYIHGNLYDLSFDAHRGWQGEGGGLGLGYGYVWKPWKNEHWKLEAFVRVGYYYSLYDPYHASDPFNGKYYYDWDGPIESFVPRNHRLRWLGPTGIGITISYDICRKLKVER